MIATSETFQSLQYKNYFDQGSQKQNEIATAGTSNNSRQHEQPLLSFWMKLCNRNYRFFFYPWADFT
jgi:hypothetical protein